MSDTKSRILYILKYLWQNTDAEHYVTTGDILTYLCQAETPYFKQHNTLCLFVAQSHQEAIKKNIARETPILTRLP